MRGRPLLPELLARRELVGNLVARNLKQRYKGSALGFLWSLLHPLFLVLIYLVFIRLMRFPMRLPHLLVGVMAWQFLALCAGDAAGVVLGHASLVKKTWFPRVILPLSAVLGNLVHFGLSLLVLGALLPALGAPPRAGWLLLPWRGRAAVRLLPRHLPRALGAERLLPRRRAPRADRPDVLVLRDAGDLRRRAGRSATPTSRPGSRRSSSPTRWPRSSPATATRCSGSRCRRRPLWPGRSSARWRSSPSGALLFARLEPASPTSCERRQPAIAVSGLGKRYRLRAAGADHAQERRAAALLARRAPRGEEFWALRGVSFDVAPRRDARRHRPQRRRQEHAARADRRDDHADRGDGRAPRGGSARCSSWAPASTPT